MLKLSSQDILPTLTSLINASLEAGVFPVNCEKALIVPLLKVHSPKSPSDTWLIALLSVPLNLIERIVRK